MKAIVLKSPWWEKILSGEKTIETRTWKTNYRGDILICAGNPIKQIVGIAEIFNVRKMTAEDESRACIKLYEAYSWELRNVRKINPVPVRGMPGIFEVKEWKSI